MHFWYIGHLGGLLFQLFQNGVNHRVDWVMCRINTFKEHVFFLSRRGTLVERTSFIGIILPVIVSSNQIKFCLMSQGTDHRNYGFFLLLKWDLCFFGILDIFCSGIFVLIGIGGDHRVFLGWFSLRECRVVMVWLFW